MSHNSFLSQFFTENLFKIDRWLEPAAFFNSAKWVSPEILEMILIYQCLKKIEFKKAENMVETYFCFIRVFFHRHWVFTGQQKKGGNHLYSSLPIPPVQGHPDIYLQFFMWDDYHVFTSLVIIILLLDEVYHLGELPFKSFMTGTVII